MELLKLAGIQKQFGKTEVLRGLDLCVDKGEFITLLGSSGCGKTTTIRIIAGLETLDSGKIFIEGNDITALDPDKRGVNMVFQNYALFPHMNVEQNIGYSLKLKGIPKAKIKSEVTQVLSLVRLPGFEKRKPDALSGGERQRVAVARAIINKPKVLLLDEPLSALDLQLRRQMQIELKRLQKQLGITFIYITHDQEEALTMSDRVAVMQNGLFEQIGSPAEIYNKPKTSYIAKFVGGANVLCGTADSIKTVENQNKQKISFNFIHSAGQVKIELDENEIPSKLKQGDEIRIAIRSEYTTFLHTDINSDGLRAVVTGKNFSGGLSRVTAKLDADTLTEVNSSSWGIDTNLEIADKVTVNWDTSKTVILEK